MVLLLAREPSRQVAYDGIGRVEEPLDVRELLPRLLQKQSSACQITPAKEVEEEQHETARNGPQVLAENGAFVRRQKLEFAEERHDEDQERHRRQEGAVGDHRKAWSTRK